MSFTIRKTKLDDIASVIGLLRDFARFEMLEESCEVTEEKLAEAMFGENAFVEGLVAVTSENIVAYAIFYPNFASFRGQKGLFLEDLYIDAEYRGKGIGDAMLNEIARIAKSRNFVRIDFQVLDWNTPAIKFYEKHGAVRDDDERHYKFTDEAFQTLAK
ncbi:MAG TPA: GNAT family N-acetyltransferase [Pyrinomonadaceae bacterium]|jgi:ribosomal protein S18 acetylase RimI-like enzyme|nr:GNAT family N-acetyltransferase [Pyrinomonadaceae bacterium]